LPIKAIFRHFQPSSEQLSKCAGFSVSPWSPGQARGDRLGRCFICARELLTKAAAEGDKQSAEMLDMMDNKKWMFKHLKA
jgi:hypothetical protein